LKDLFHASQRVLKTLSKFHADYSNAKKDFQMIFAKIKHESSYPKMQDLKKELKKWLQNYSKSSTLEKLNDIEKVKFIGNYFYSILNLLKDMKLHKNLCPVN
jgi:predicted nucleotide-binding protein (sugar kinase/HSP70/actin superfamily)